MKTRIYFILSGENLFHPYYFSDFLNKTDNKYEVVGVTIPKEKYTRGLLNFLEKQFNLWGLLGFIYIAVMDKYRGFFVSIKMIGDKNKIPVIRVENINDPGHINYLKKLDIDVIISSQGQIFRSELLKLPKVACINRHTGLLPMYGGSMPLFWAMFNREKKFGVSVHYMTEKIDGGNILYQEAISINKDYSLFRNYIFAFKKSADVTLKALENLLEGNIFKKFYTNDKQYFSFPSFEIIRSFKMMHKTFSVSDILFFNRVLKIK